jgi:hypothetical protein
MKKIDMVLKQFANSLTQEELSKLYTRLNQKYEGDLATALAIISDSNYCDGEVNLWLESASNSNEFFDMVDTVTKFINKEYDRRSSRDRAERQEKARSR